ncbi:MAG: hypothetical protein QNL62_12880, partial [Gammaproteobacteria bacterium]|nr:hypothetical protein [Gammaproteobacteria bacterium]
YEAANDVGITEPMLSRMHPLLHWLKLKTKKAAEYADHHRYITQHGTSMVVKIKSSTTITTAKPYIQVKNYDEKIPITGNNTWQHNA